MLTTTRRAPALVAATMLMVALVPALAGTAAANHGDRKLEVEPEFQSLAQTNGEAVVTARLCRPNPPTNPCANAEATVETGAIRIHFEFEAGPNDPDGDTPLTPDGACVIIANDHDCELRYTGSGSSGTDVIRAWIDHSGTAGANEADETEGRDETVLPGAGGTECGAPAEPDCTDVVEVTWGAQTLDCDDSTGPDTERETNPSGGGAASNETYTCNVRTPTGAAANSTTVRAEVESGPNDPDASPGASYDSPDYSCTTPAAPVPPTQTAGRCQITVTQNRADPGTATICFWVGTVAEGAALCADEPVNEAQAVDGSDTANDAADKTELTWAGRTATGLDAEPETAAAEPGTNHNIRGRIYDQFGEPFPTSATINFEFFSGSPNDTDGNTPATPDDSCTTVNSSTCFITISSSLPGVDLVCVWIGADPVMAGISPEGTCDGEARVDPDDDATTEDAPAPPSDDVDVVRVSWGEVEEASELTLTPAETKSLKGDQVTLTARVRGADGNPIEGAVVAWAEAGPGSFVGEPETRTDENGEATAVVTSDDPGNQRITAATTPCAADGDCSDRSTVHWGPVRCDVYGTNGNDILRSSRRGQTICGFAGDDVIEGRGGDDLLLGNAGDDTLSGGRGDDTLNGGKGTDLCAGGSGRDRRRNCE